MASLTDVNDPVTDSVTQTNVTVMAGSPAIALASQMLSTCHAHSLMAYNAVYAQQNAQILGLSSLADHIIPTTGVNREGNGSLQLSEGLSSLNNTLQSIDKDLLMGNKGNRYGGY
jgi:hypothetical protein